MEWGWANYVRDSDDADNPYASPLRADDLSGLPAATIITAGFDPLRDEGQAYARRLQQAAVPAHLKHYEGMIHAFWHLGGVLDQGRQVIDEAGAALRAAFRVKHAETGSGPAPTDALVEALWPGEEQPQRPARALRAIVSRLRRLVGEEAVVTASAGYRLAIPARELDAARFEARLAEGRAAVSSARSWGWSRHRGCRTWSGEC